ADVHKLQVPDAAVTDAAVTDAAVTDAAVTGAAVTGATVTDAAVTGATVTDAGVTDAAVTGATGTGAAVTGATVTDAGVTDAAVTGATGTGAAVTGATGTDAGVTDAAVTGATGTDAAVTGATVTDAGVTGATVTDAAATDAAVTGATATGAAVTDAAVTGAAVTGAAVTGAAVTGAAVTGATATGATATAAMVPLAGPTAPVSVPLLNTSTPFGPVALTLNGTVDLATLQVAFNSGSIALPTPLALGIDALGPYYLATTALQNSAIAFGNAISSGNPLAAAGTLFFAPVNAVNSFLFGQGTITQLMAAPAGLGYSDVAFSVPVGGLLSPLQPFTLTLTPTSGTPTSIALGGTQVGGLVPGLLGLLPGF
ncbi:hypothetical protein A4G26_25655, partial [Mycobacterium kansasii]